MESRVQNQPGLRTTAARATTCTIYWGVHAVNSCGFIWTDKISWGQGKTLLLAACKIKTCLKIFHVSFSTSSLWQNAHIVQNSILLPTNTCLTHIGNPTLLPVLSWQMHVMNSSQLDLRAFTAEDVWKRLPDSENSRTDRVLVWRMVLRGVMFPEGSWNWVFKTEQEEDHGSLWYRVTANQPALGTNPRFVGFFSLDFVNLLI